jgi:hypothetical protein
VDLLVPLFDSVSAARSAGRRLRFGRPGGEPVLEVEIRQVGPAVRLAGLVPPGARLEIRGQPVPADSAGYFTAEVTAGPLRLLITESGGRISATGWL